jgi:fused signal recognition particle receptor
MFWRRRPKSQELPAEGEAPVSDEEIEAQLTAELEAAAAAADGRAGAPADTIEVVVPTLPVASATPIVAAVPAPVAPAAPVRATPLPNGALWGDPDPAAIEAVEDGDIAAGVARSRGGFVARLKGILHLGDPDAEAWEEVEEILIAGDVGATLAMEVVERARRRRDPGGPEAAVRAELEALLAPREDPVAVAATRPAIVLVVGVNGTGKTTTIGKLAARYRAEGNRVLLAAGDTFRAAAIEQLRLWGDRAGAPVIAHAPGADPAAVIYDAVDAAVARDIDVLIADTAGRLHTKVNLMDELAKMRRVIDRRLPGATPEVLFVLDATTGQNGLSQAKAFHESTGLTGIVLTKLDSTAKGGIVFAIEHALGVPVRFVGVGEKMGDLLPFDPHAFVAALFA